MESQTKEVLLYLKVLYMYLSDDTRQPSPLFDDLIPTRLHKPLYLLGVEVMVIRVTDGQVATKQVYLPLLLPLVVALYTTQSIFHERPVRNSPGTLQDQFWDDIPS